MGKPDLFEWLIEEHRHEQRRYLIRQLRKEIIYRLDLQQIPFVLESWIEDTLYSGRLDPSWDTADQLAEMLISELDGRDESWCRETGGAHAPPHSDDPERVELVQ